MFDGLADEEIDRYLEENPKLVPGFEIDVIKAISPYMSRRNRETEEVLHEEDPKIVEELRHAREALE